MHLVLRKLQLLRRLNRPCLGLSQKKSAQKVARVCNEIVRFLSADKFRPTKNSAVVIVNININVYRSNDLSSTTRSRVNYSGRQLIDVLMSSPYANTSLCQPYYMQ